MRHAAPLRKIGKQMELHSSVESGGSVPGTQFRRKDVSQAAPGEVDESAPEGVDKPLISPD